MEIKEFEEKLEGVTNSRCGCSLWYAMQYSGVAIALLVMEAKGIITSEEADFLHSFF